MLCWLSPAYSKVCFCAIAKLPTHEKPPEDIANALVNESLDIYYVATEVNHECNLLKLRQRGADTRRELLVDIAAPRKASTLEIRAVEEEEDTIMSYDYLDGCVCVCKENIPRKQRQKVTSYSSTSPPAGQKHRPLGSSKRIFKIDLMFPHTLLARTMRVIYIPLHSHTSFHSRIAYAPNLLSQASPGDLAMCETLPLQASHLPRKPSSLPSLPCTSFR